MALAPGLGCSDRGETSEAACAPTPEMETQASRKMPGACLTEIDDDVDGIIDRTLVHDYDAADLLRFVEYARVDEGPLWRKDWTYDDSGRALVEEALDLTTGSLVYRTTFEYAGEDLVRAVKLDAATDEAERVSVYTYGADGKLVVVDVDRDADGEFLHRYTYQYEDERKASSREEYYWEDAWHPIWERQHVYDASGFEVEEHYDHRSGTEFHDGVTSYVNDRFGNPLVAEHIDLVDDGRICSFHYYACETTR